MFLLGINIGTSFVTVSLVNGFSQQVIISKQWPDSAVPVVSLHQGWAEQSPELWWEYVQTAILLCHCASDFNKISISAIGISYQMHGLVLVDTELNVLRNSMISSDSRASEIGNDAYKVIGKEYCLTHLLNSPDIFPAAKLAWVKKYEVKIYNRIFKVMQLGDYISMRLTGEISTTIPALSEGIFYDFKSDEISNEILRFFDFEHSIFPDQKKVFSTHGYLLQSVADKLHLKKGIPISYKAGNHLSNALSLNVINPGEIAASYAISGVLTGITNKLIADRQLRMNVLAHVNYAPKRKRLAVILAVKRLEHSYHWHSEYIEKDVTYDRLNTPEIFAHSGNNFQSMPSRNEVKRALKNKLADEASTANLNMNATTVALAPAELEIAYAFRDGLDILRENGMQSKVVRAPYANLFMSDFFARAFVNLTKVPLELYKTDESIGAALGAGIGTRLFSYPSEAFSNLKPIKKLEPEYDVNIERSYRLWRTKLFR